VVWNCRVICLGNSSCG